MSVFDKITSATEEIIGRTGGRMETRNRTALQQKLIKQRKGKTLNELPAGGKEIG